jgi:hypothetical protein
LIPGYEFIKSAIYLAFYFETRLSAKLRLFVYNRLSFVETWVDSSLNWIGRRAASNLTTPLKAHLSIVRLTLLGLAPEQIEALTSACQECLDSLAAHKRENGFYSSYTDEVSSVAKQACKSKVQMNIKALSTRGASQRYFPYDIWLEGSLLYWQAEGDDLVNSDVVVAVEQEQPKALAIKLRLESTAKMVKFKEPGQYQEWLTRLHATCTI